MPRSVKREGGKGVEGRVTATTDNEIKSSRGTKLQPQRFYRQNAFDATVEILDKSAKP